MLIQWGCDRSGEEGLPAYVDAHQAAAPLYRKFRFRERTDVEVDLQGALPMVRESQLKNSNVATTSRQVYAFARDKGLPFSNFCQRSVFSSVNPTFIVPLNALCMSLAIVSLLSLINIGSSVAFNAIMSLARQLSIPHTSSPSPAFACVDGAISLCLPPAGA
ncbi:hypothetical protein V6Z77_004802 [Aspergillus fumigatus]